jgi:hypothetical protein
MNERVDMKGKIVGLAAVLMGVMVFPSHGTGQVRLIPQGGLYASVSDLGTVDSPDGALDVGEQETSFAYGLTVDLSRASTVGFRVTGLYGSDSEVPVGGIGCEGSACDVRSTLLALSGTAVLRPFGAGVPLRPYFLAGGGFKRFDFDPGSESPVKDAFDDQSVGSAVLGLGFDWNLGILTGTLELADYISGAIFEDGDRQHDFFLTLGLVLG